MPVEGSSGRARAVRLLLKAVRGLPEHERQAVLSYLLERALEPAEGSPRGGLGPSLTTPDFVQEAGELTGRLLRLGEGIAGIARLYSIPEEAVRAALHEVISDSEAPQPLASILGLLAEGRSQAEAALELGLSADEMTRAFEALPSSRLEGRLGKALFAHARMLAQVSVVFERSRPRIDPALGAERRGRGGAVDPEALAAGIGRLLVAGSGIGHVATLYDVPEHAVAAALREAARHPDASEPLASVLRLLADGRTQAEVAEELCIAEDEVSTALAELLPSPLERRLSHALQAALAVRSAGPPWPPSLPGVAVGGSLGAEPQMVPVRFPESQYRRLKEWCAQHGFSMAVVVRGLVERFLDDQERRAA